MLPQLDDRFSGHQNTVTLIESLTEAINKYATLQSSDQLQCSWFSGAANGQKKQKYLCYLHEMEIGNIDRMIKDKLPDLEGLSVEEAKKSMEDLMLKKQYKFFNHFWQSNVANCVVTSNEEGEQILVKYSGKSALKRGLELIVNWLENNKVAIRRKQIIQLLNQANIDIKINSVFNFLIEDPRVFLYKHGAWAAFKHINLMKTIGIY